MIFPLIIFTEIFLLLNDKHAVHESLINSILAVCAFQVYAAELLSLFNLYKAVALYIIYAVTAGILLYVILKRKIRFKTDLQLNVSEKIIIAVCFGLIIINTAMGLFFPATRPIDSDMYHMVRSYFYAQNGNIHNYTTGFGHQLFFGPANAIFISQLMLLNGGRDLFAFVPQLTSLILAGAGCYGITYLFSKDRKLSLLSFLLVLLIPLNIAQATTTQNDLMLTAFCLAAVYHMAAIATRMKKGEECGALCWIFTGLSCGLAVLTKVNAGLNLVLFAAAFALYALIKIKGRAIIKGLIVIVCALSIFGGFWFRNSKALDGDFLGTSYVNYSSGEDNHKMTVPEYGLLFLENITSTTCYPSEILHSISEKVVYGYADLFNLDVNSKAVSRGEIAYGHTRALSSDSCPYPILTFFGFLSLIIGLINAKKRDGMETAYNMLTLFTVLAVCLLINWSSSSSRYLLFAMTLTVPVIARELLNRKVFVIAVVGLFALNALAAYVANNHYWYKETPEGRVTRLAESLEDITAYVGEDISANKRTSIGIYETEGTRIPVYFFMHYLNCNDTKAVYLSGDLVFENSYTDVIPECILYSTTSAHKDLAKELIISGNTYRLEYEYTDFWQEVDYGGVGYYVMK